jgi:hypothetical protein
VNRRTPTLPKTLRRAGDVLGLVLTVGFVVATLVCWSRYGLHLAIAGVPHFDVATLLLYAKEPALPLRALHWLLAWAWLVATGGCAVLAVAGLRWTAVRIRELMAETAG